jgi:FkbM family methyltransferase
MNLRSKLVMLAKFLYWKKVPTVDGDSYTIRNPWVVFNNSGTIDLTDGTKLRFDSHNKSDVFQVALFALENGIRFGQDDGQWKVDQASNTIETPQKIKFYMEGFEARIFAETFLQDIHFVDFDLRGKTVVEAGAFLGDTALYYASKGAMVYSFEPDLKSYELAKKNIFLNPDLSGNISLSNCAIGKDGEIDFPVDDATRSSASVYSHSPRFRKVKSLSLRTIIEEHNIDHPYLLHLDIKGEEFTIIKENAITNFDRVRMEYSSYLRSKKIDERSLNLDMLLRTLRADGFKDIRLFKHNHERYDLRSHGTIDARK